MEALYFNGFSSLKTNLLPRYLDGKPNQLKKGRRNFVFEKNEILSKMLINSMVGHEGFQLIFTVQFLSVKRIKRTKRL